MPRRGMSSADMSEQDFHLVADEELEEIHDAVEEALEEGFGEDFDCNMSVGDDKDPFTFHQDYVKGGGRKASTCCIARNWLLRHDPHTP